ncbi:hypothetical protein [Streptomyces sp. CAU 1734]|uniref:hypothetical protein n=1 Tax=Streptomyces sp. CAU 1734 TaxID=3140360 RepID=UPI003260E647
MTDRRTAPETPAPRDALDSLGQWRLRPGVSATVLRDGVHLRGWITSVSLEGNPAIPALWEHLADALAGDGGTALAGAAPAGSPLRAALVTLIGRLHDHDLLVERYGTDGTPGGLAGQWLDTAAGRPAEAADRLARVRTRLLAGRPDGALARAAGRALHHSGTPAEPVRDTGLPAGRIILTAASTAGGEVFAVAAGVYAGGGFVTPVGSPGQVRADAAALAARPARREARDTGEHPAVSALVAAAAAQRLLCAAAGLSDPSAEAGGARLLPELPAVLIAGERPLRGEYRTWPRPAPADGGRPAAGAAPLTLADALARIPVLGDGEVGVLDEPSPGALPQLPVPLVRCAVPGGALFAGAARADLARLEAVCRAAELTLGGADLVVGVNPEHARGRALRRAAGRPHSGGPGAPERPVVWRPDGAVHPQARHWWSVLVRRLGVAAEAAVFRIGADDGVFRAEVRGRPAAGGPPRLLGTGVEATADDAAAYAALRAVVRVQLRAHAPDLRHLALPSGASAVLAATAEPAPWEDGGWTTAWLGETAGREKGLRDALAEVTGVRPRPWEPARGAPAHPVWSALRQCGFSVLAMEPGGYGAGGASGSHRHDPVRTALVEGLR